MKKTLSIIVLSIAIIVLGATAVNATTASGLADKLYDMGKGYGLTAADKVKIQRFVSDNNVTDAEADELVSKAAEVVAVLDNAGAKSIADLSGKQLDQVKSIANEAADVVGVKLVFGDHNAKVYKNGKLIETVTNNNGKLSYTGNDTVNVLVISSVAVVALATAYVAIKKFANA